MRVSKGNRVELLGKVRVQRSQAYRLKVTLEDGNETTVYLDADTYLEIREVRKLGRKGREVETETNIGNYKEFEGFFFPTRIETKRQTFTVEMIELNPPLEAMTFAMPENREATKSSPRDTVSPAEAGATASAPSEAADSDKPLTADAIAKLTSGGSSNDQTGDQEGGSAHKKKQQKALTNVDVIALVKADLGDKVVIDKIRSSPGDKLDTSTDALIRLKKAGVSTAVIDAMIKRGDAQ